MRRTQMTTMSRAFDVFLCHSGGDDGRVKLLLGVVRSKLHELPPLGGGTAIRAFRDEDDLNRAGRVQDALHAAIVQAPTGARCQALSPQNIAVLQIGLLLLTWRRTILRPVNTVLRTAARPCKHRHARHCA